MNNASFFSDLLNSIAERGRALVGRPVKSTARAEDLAALARGLLSGRGEATGAALAIELLDGYATLEASARGSAA